MSCNTIQKYLNTEVQDGPKYRRKANPTQLTPFHETLKQAREIDAWREEMGFDQAALDAVASAGFSNGTFEETIEETL
ncbi:hypothetical protein [Paraburkholderia largidicola]|uniref:Uncharacterized protein n=1 Tax=Paraburkholderia largidicola TaxID=3014751 RepID=A0A7I8BER9_9BURK|nr:hypothetical protein [Paraburkholderia sp. PGU16]BCF87084.1 hypothetical protein PPGU16_01510 [Paraburkholderia sp. PGU16]